MREYYKKTVVNTGIASRKCGSLKTRLLMVASKRARDFANHFLMQAEGVATILSQKNSVFSGDNVATVDSSVHAQRDEGNRSESTKHDRRHLKNILGGAVSNNDKSRAHAFPKDKECNKWWWPMFQLVTGHQDRTEHNQSTLDKVASMRTNRIVFPAEHNHIFVCTIPTINGRNGTMAVPKRIQDAHCLRLSRHVPETSNGPGGKL